MFSCNFLKAQTNAPCLSFDVIPDNLGDLRTEVRNIATLQTIKRNNLLFSKNKLWEWFRPFFTIILKREVRVTFLLTWLSILSAFCKYFCPDLGFRAKLQQIVVSSIFRAQFLNFACSKIFLPGFQIQSELLMADMVNKSWWICGFSYPYSPPSLRYFPKKKNLS